MVWLNFSKPSSQCPPDLGISPGHEPILDQRSGKLDACHVNPSRSSREYASRACMIDLKPFQSKTWSG